MIEYESLKNTNSMFVEELKAACNKVIENGWYVLGTQVKEFEDNFAKYHDSKHCTGVASGTDAILIAFRALDLPKGSEVIVSGNTYIATIFPIVRLGLIPRIVEADITTYNIDPESLSKNINKNTKAVLITHMHGKLCDMDNITKICRENDLFLLEDCAQAHGAELNGKKAGTFGDFGCFSFYPTKNLGALGDAGAILIKSKEHYEKIQLLRNNGMGKKYYHELVGYNSRLDEIQAAMLNVKLNYLNKIIDHKIELSKVYFENIPKSFITPIKRKGYKDVFHIFSVRHDKRDELREFLLKNDIKTEIHYPVAPHLQESLKHLEIEKGTLPITEKLHDTTLSLPISYSTTKEDVLKICDVLNQFDS